MEDGASRGMSHLAKGDTYTSPLFSSPREFSSPSTKGYMASPINTPATNTKLKTKEGAMRAEMICNGPVEMQNGGGEGTNTPQLPRSALKRSATAASDKPKSDKYARVRFAQKANMLPGLIDYTSDDDRTIALKRQGYSNAQVANQMQLEGRKRTSNSVNNRWIRLRKALTEREEELLDDELSDWHADEDDKLHEAHMLVQEKMHKDIEAIKAKMWNEVSTDLAKRMEKRKYTAKACKERFEGLIDGSALTPLELDSDQDGRDNIRQARIANAKRDRDDHYYALQYAHNQHLAVLAAAKNNKGKKKGTYAEELKKRQDEKAAMERIRKEQRMEADKVRQTEMDEKQRLKDMKLWPDELANAEYEALDTFLHRKPGASANEAKLERRRSTIHLVDDVIDLVNTPGGEDDEDASARAHHLFTAISDQLSFNLGILSNLVPDPLRPVVKKKPIPIFGLKATPGSIPITRESLLNSRSIMPPDELEILFKERNLPRRSLTESQPQMVARLAFEDEALNQAGLLRLLSKYFDKGKSSKEDLIQRLQIHDVNNCDSLLGSSSDDIEFMMGYEGYKGEFRYLIDIYSGAVVGMAPPSSPMPCYDDDDEIDSVMAMDNGQPGEFVDYDSRDGYGLLAAMAEASGTSVEDTAVL